VTRYAHSPAELRKAAETSVPAECPGRYPRWIWLRPTRSGCHYGPSPPATQVSKSLGVQMQRMSAEEFMAQVLEDI
jgi:hypothetical protein